MSSSPTRPAREPTLTWNAGLRELLDQAQDGWVLTSAVRDGAGDVVDFRVEYMNGPGLQAVNLDSDAVGRTYRELFPAVVEQGLLDAYVRGFLDDTPVRRSVWYDDGRVRGFYTLTVIPFGAGFAMCFANTTDLVLAQARAEGEERLRAALDSSFDGVLLLSAARHGEEAAFTVDYANPRAASALALDRERIVGMSLRALLPPHVRERWWPSLRHALLRGESADVPPQPGAHGVAAVAMHAVPLGDGVAVSFRSHGDEPARARQDERGGDQRAGERDRMLGFHAVTAALSRATTIDELVSELRDRIAPALGVRSHALLSDDGRVLSLSGPRDDHARERAAAVLDTGVAAFVDRGGEDLPVGGGWAVLPLHAGDRVVGACALGYPSPRAFDPGTRAVLGILGELLGQALAAAAMRERERALTAVAERERGRLRTIVDTLDEGVIALDADGEVTLANPAAERLHGPSIRTRGTPEWADAFGIRRLDGAAVDPADLPIARVLAGEAVDGEELLVTPEGGDGTLVIAVTGRPLPGEGGRSGAVVTLQDVTERRFAEAALQRQALHDALTGLPNRRLLIDRAEQALARARRGHAAPAAFFFDLDRFKVINDSLGHDVGDRLLVEVASRLSRAVRPSDTVARLGGDEFVVLCEDVPDETTAAEICGRVESAFTSAFGLGGGHGTTVVSTSIGVAFAEPDDDAERLLRKADQAMYLAKEQGRGRSAVFDPSLGRRAEQRLVAETALREALDAGRLRLRYQPVVDLGDGRILGAEALLRYEATDGTLVPPAAFLDIAEETGLIVPIAHWVVEEASRQLGAWKAATGERTDLAINLSARQLASTEVLRLIRDRVDGVGRLRIEITEGTLMDASASTVAVLHELREAGVAVGIDDFGTGYSSLTYLRRLPVDFLKVDRSFVAGLGRDEDDSVIVDAVLSLAEALGLDAIAEGVETPAQVARLRDLGCGRAQGFLLARPLPAEEFGHLLDAGTVAVPS